MASIEPTEEHIALVDAWKAAVGKEGANIDVAIIVALLSQFLGSMIALLDQRKYTPELAMLLVQENIVIGNEEMLKVIMNPEGEA